MNQSSLAMDPLALDSSADLQTVLTAWHSATLRLEQTHEALRAEVRHLTEELEAKNRELARKNRLADLGQMASHVAHEVRNSLVPVTLYLSLLRRRVSHDPAGADALEKLSRGFTALDAMVNDLLHFTADHVPQLQTFSVRALVEDLEAAIALQLQAQGIRMFVEVPEGQTVTADREMFRRAVLNLVLNAVDAMPDGGPLSITSVSTPQGIELEVADAGPGLSEKVICRIFEPFFTTKRGGTGLGLVIVSRIAEVHGGHVTAANCPEGGAAFTLWMPHGAARPAPAATAQEAAT
ncbi:MAG: ATP-binding protein [Thermoguttaceae bacterium]|jgi:signal transduction histidine kinase